MLPSVYTQLGPSIEQIAPSTILQHTRVASNTLCNLYAMQRHVLLSKTRLAWFSLLAQMLYLQHFSWCPPGTRATLIPYH